MKPPPRKRVKTCRDLRPVPEARSRRACKWPRREQMKLLTALIKLCPKGGPEEKGEELLLNLERVKKHLPSRTLGEIGSVLDSLKERVIRFARARLQSERKEEQRGRRRLELWIHEASAVSPAVEESLSSAFSQLLTVASTEPCSVMEAKSPQAHSDSSQECTAQSSTVPDTTPKSTVTNSSHLSSMYEVNFEKIYQYLSLLHKPNTKCWLTPMESAVVLDLLMSLPEELLLLDCDPIIQHLSQTYPHLISSADNKRTKTKPVKQQSPVVPATNQPQAASSGLHQPPTGSTDHPNPPAGLKEDPNPPTGSTENLQPPTGLTEHPKPPTGLTEHPKPPTGLKEDPNPQTRLTDNPKPPTGLKEDPNPQTGLTDNPNPPAGLTEHPNPPSGSQEDNSIPNTRQITAVLNPLLIPVNLLTRKRPDSIPETKSQT